MILSLSVTNTGCLLNSARRLIPSWCSGYLPWYAFPDIFQKATILTRLSFFLWPVECCSTRCVYVEGCQEFNGCVAWVHLWPPMIKCCSCIEHVLESWTCAPAVGTQGCQHVGLRKILVNSRRIPLWWGSSSQTPALWAATETDCLLICLESLFFPRELSYISLTLSPSNTQWLRNPAFPLPNSLSPNKAWYLGRVDGDKTWGGMKDVRRVTTCTVRAKITGHICFKKEKNPTNPFWVL